jgi:hypothetical protein
MIPGFGRTGFGRDQIYPACWFAKLGTVEMITIYISRLKNITNAHKAWRFKWSMDQLIHKFKFFGAGKHVNIDNVVNPKP